MRLLTIGFTFAGGRAFMQAPRRGRHHAQARILHRTPRLPLRPNRGTRSNARQDQRQTRHQPKNKVEIIADLLRRKEGCTTAEVLEAVSWPAISMPQQAKAAGIKLRKVKEGKITRYYAA
jgi:hypothetical protein